MAKLFKRKVDVFGARFVRGVVYLRRESVTLTGKTKWAVERAAKYVGVTEKDMQAMMRHGLNQKLADAALANLSDTEEN